MLNELKGRQIRSLKTKDETKEEDKIMLCIGFSFDGKIWRRITLLDLKIRLYRRSVWPAVGQITDANCWTKSVIVDRDWKSLDITKRLVTYMSHISQNSLANRAINVESNCKFLPTELVIVAEPLWEDQMWIKHFYEGGECGLEGQIPLLSHFH